MADERTSAAQSTSELDAADAIELIDLIDEVEPIEDAEGDDASTGQYAPRHTLVGSQFSPTMRPSSPPPVPPEARQSRPPARPNSEPPSARSRSQSGMFRIERPSDDGIAPALRGGASFDGIAPALRGGASFDGTAPALRGGASFDGTAPALRGGASFDGTAPALRGGASVLPPAPPTIGTSAPAQSQSPEAQELRETRAYVQRLRLMIRLREDRIHELETALRAQQGRAEALAQQLAQRTSQPAAADDLKLIAGIGPKFERALHAAGVSTFRQIAEWTPADVERMAEQLRTVRHRIIRDRWVERARALLTDSQG